MTWFWIILVIVIIFYFSNKNSENNYSTQNIQEPKKTHLNQKIIDISDIELSNEQQKMFELVETTNDNIFITGKAGTGKSVLLQYLKLNSKKKMVILAPTGVAALNIGGQTIHSFFRIPPSFIAKDSLSVNYKVATILRNVDSIVIDEISMVRADLMDAIDSLLKQARSSNEPFGGVQIILFGDLYQLPPVVSDPELHKYFADNFGGFYFFNAEVWKIANLKIYELSKIFRQADETFKKILNSIRSGNTISDLLSTLNLRANGNIPETEVVTLVTTNQLVNEINDYHLSKIDEKLYEYRARIHGDIEKSSFPTEEILKLKKGSQVMLLRNDREKRWVNGTLGIISDLSENQIKISIDGIIFTVLQETWNKIRYTYNQTSKSIEEEVVSSFTQYPLRLAWAMTIHKSQGKTLESAVIDMGDGAFAHGQTYVALSRCKSLEGLYLKRAIKNEDIIVDPVVVSFMSKAEILEINDNIDV